MPTATKLIRKFFTNILFVKSRANAPTHVRANAATRNRGHPIPQPLITLPVKKSNGECIFLKNNRCDIYAIRPKACRSYPFYLEPDTLNLFVDIGCSGVEKGEVIDYERVRVIATDLSKTVVLNRARFSLLKSLLFNNDESDNIYTDSLSLASA